MRDDERRRDVGVVNVARIRTIRRQDVRVAVISEKK